MRVFVLARFATLPTEPSTGLQRHGRQAGMRCALQRTCACARPSGRARSARRPRRRRWSRSSQRWHRQTSGCSYSPATPRRPQRLCRNGQIELPRLYRCAVVSRRPHADHRRAQRRVPFRITSVTRWDVNTLPPTTAARSDGRSIVLAMRCQARGQPTRPSAARREARSATPVRTAAGRATLRES